MNISAHLAQVLEAGRTHFNTRVAEARHRYPALDTAAFTSFLQSAVDVVAIAVASVEPERVTAAVAAAYDMGLELVGQGLAGPGARHDLVNRVWQTVVPQYAKLLSEQPYELLGVLSNAAVNLCKYPNARSEQWINEMIGMSKHADTFFQLRSIGQIMAWRAGLAHFRKGAIGIADQLPELIALAAVGAKVSESWPSVRSNFLSDPWWSPENEGKAGSNPEKILIEIGQFSGLGGQFRLPPEVRATEDGFYINSAGQYFYLLADIYGAILLPSSAEEFNQSKVQLSNKKASLQGATIVFENRKVSLDLPAEGLSLSSNEHTVAISSPYTFSIQLFPL